MTQLDEILNHLVDSTLGSAVRELEVASAKAQILQYIESVIGPDLPHGSGQNVSWEAGIDWQNQLKAEQRQRLHDES